jgi:transcriptional regulator with XRE-family HTH domain
MDAPIKSYLTRSGMTQMQLAEKTGLSQPFISRLLRGGDISLDVALKLHQALDIPLHVMRPDAWPTPTHARTAK